MRAPAVFLAFALLAPARAAAQSGLPPVRYPEIPPTASAASGFAPAGWKVEAAAQGDVNRDGKADLALVLRATDPANIVPTDSCENPLDTNPRILVVALAEASGFRRVVANRTLIPRRENSCAVDWFDPEASLVISGGALRLSLERMMSMGSWAAGTNGFVLRWQDDAMRLIGWDYSSVHRGSGESAEISINFLTGSVITAKGNIQYEDRDRRFTELRRRPLLTLDQIGDGLEFDPDGLVAKLP